MSNITIQPNASGTGTFSIASPNSNTSRTLTLPDTTGELLNDASSLASGKLTGALPAIDGSALTGVGSTTYDAVGTYLLARPAQSTPDIEAGATVAGSTLAPCALSGSTTTQVPSGTWRLMGKSDLTSSAAASRGSLWVRIS